MLYIVVFIILWIISTSVGRKNSIETIRNIWNRITIRNTKWIKKHAIKIWQIIYSLSIIYNIMQFYWITCMGLHDAVWCLTHRQLAACCPYLVLSFVAQHHSWLNRCCTATLCSASRYHCRTLHHRSMHSITRQLGLHWAGRYCCSNMQPRAIITRQPSGTTGKEAWVNDVSKRLKHSYFGFTTRAGCASRLTSQCGTNPCIEGICTRCSPHSRSLRVLSVTVMLLFHWFELKKTG